jgi:hypothetical protein
MRWQKLTLLEMQAYSKQKDHKGGKIKADANFDVDE